MRGHGVMRSISEWFIVLLVQPRKGLLFSCYIWIWVALVDRYTCVVHVDGSADARVVLCTLHHQQVVIIIIPGMTHKFRWCMNKYAVVRTRVRPSAASAGRGMASGKWDVTFGESVSISPNHRQSASPSIAYPVGTVTWPGDHLPRKPRTIRDEFHLSFSSFLINYNLVSFWMLALRWRQSLGMISA